MHETKLKRRIERLDTLPVHPYVLARTLHAVHDAPDNARRLAALFTCDAGLAARLLRVHREQRSAG